MYVSDIKIKCCESFPMAAHSYLCVGTSRLVQELCTKIILATRTIVAQASLSIYLGQKAKSNQ